MQRARQTFARCTELALAIATLAVAIIWFLPSGQAASLSSAAFFGVLMILAIGLARSNALARNIALGCCLVLLFALPVLSYVRASSDVAFDEAPHASFAISLSWLVPSEVFLCACAFGLASRPRAGTQPRTPGAGV